MRRATHKARADRHPARAKRPGAASFFEFREFNIADWFSFYRIVAAPVLVALLVLDQRPAFTWLLTFSFVTDMIDGQLARRLGLVSPRGSQLDSVGDQVTLLVGVAGVARFETAFVREELVLIVVPLALYFTQMFIALYKYGRATSFHTYLAKTSSLVQGIFICWLLFFGPCYWLFYTMVFLAVIETAEELTLVYLNDEWRSDIKSLLAWRK
jgi:phosphatidylglycerophosphate synthase